MGEINGRILFVEPRSHEEHEEREDILTDFITIHSSQIREISEKGISYLDDSGEEGFIDFENCYQNFLKRCLSLEAYEKHIELNPSNHHKTYEEYVGWIKSMNEIGRRNVCGRQYSFDDNVTSESDNPYFEFFTNPLSVVECDNQDEYWKVRKGFEKHGWRTQDMS